MSSSKQTPTARTALIVVDLQTGTAAYQHTYPVDDVVTNINAVARAVRAASGHIFTVRHDPTMNPLGVTQYGGGPWLAPVARGNLRRW